MQKKSFLQLAIRAAEANNLLAQTSFQLAPKAVWRAELISRFVCYSNSSKKITCPLGKLKTEFTSPIEKSTSPGLSDTTFFAGWLPAAFTANQSDNETQGSEKSHVFAKYLCVHQLNSKNNDSVLSFKTTFRHWNCSHSQLSWMMVEDRHGLKLEKKNGSISEMPTSGDLKSGDSLFFTTLPPPPEIQWTPTPQPWQIWQWHRTLYEVLLENLRSSFWCQISFFSD